MRSVGTETESAPHDELLVRVSPSSTQDAATPLTAATATVNGLRALLFAAAQQAGDELGVPPKYVVMSAEAFLQTIDLSTERGSFVWRLRIPVEFWALPVHEAVDEPRLFGREVTETVVRWLTAASNPDMAAPDYGERYDFAEALLTTLAPNTSRGEVAFDVRLAEVGGRTPARAVQRSFTSDDVVRVGEFVRRQRERRGYAEAPPAASRGLEPPLQAFARYVSFVLVGEVVALQRPDVTIAGDVFGRTRRVRLALAPHDYQRAADAHLRSLEVTVVGALQLRPRSARMTEIEALLVEGEDD
jgi:hypothetical protein